MKLKDWADLQGISYLTAWRWFKAGDSRLSNAYQSDSGTIIVPEESDSSEQSMGNTVHSNDVMSTVLKKTVEFSKSNVSIEDFAAWILSNFSLKPNTYSEGPKYSRVKPKSEEVQKHFNQFLKTKGEKPKPNMFVAEDDALDELMAQSDDLTTRELVDEIHKIGAAAGAPVNPTDAPEVGDLMKDLSFALNTPVNYSGVEVKTLANVAEGVVARSVDLTPQHLNYTDSGNSTFGNNSTYSVFTAGTVTNSLVAPTESSTLLRAASTSGAVFSSAFHPTQKEIESASRINTVADTRPRRGRKPSKNKDNK